ncbi:MAG: DUF4445 domain-containing protein [Clostridia bacterium]|nr:DUF4445 domain-containing protein [Clostridia bacterium]
MKNYITVLPENRVIEVARGEILLDVLAQNGIFLPAACAGKGTCGKCRVRLIRGEVTGVCPDANGCFLSCHAVIKGDLTIEIGAQEGMGLNTFDTTEMIGDTEGTGVILDIGTTTLAAASVDLATGAIVRRCSSLNPQGVCGADVLTRIKAYIEGRGELLQRLILEQTKELLLELGVTDIKELTIAANTTMLHLFLGVDPATIGVYPFTPVFTDEQCRSGGALGLPVGTVRLLPSVGAYIGSDITAGVLSVGMHRGTRTELFVDVGTNGEIVLSHRGRLYAASTAAGPALEGACIECGMGGIAGAIDHVALKSGRITISTVGSVSARGICGSGLIDLIALLLREGLIDETGAWDTEADSFAIQYLRGDRFYLTEEIYLSQADIRQFQLAKSAIAAGIGTLLSECDVTVNAVETLYLAGGIGYYMDIRNAAEVGLLPRALTEKTRSVGNTALAGARLCLLDARMREEIARIARGTTITELSFSDVFQDAYVENMMFS